MADLRKQIKERLRYLSDWERDRVGDLITAENAGDWPRHEALKMAFLEHLEEELTRYFSWNLKREEKLALRRKFLNITGIWDIIPQEELRLIASRAAEKRKHAVADYVGSPWQLAFDVPEEEEIPAVDLKFCEPFATFLNQFQKVDGVSYLDYVSGSRDKRIYPFAHAVCFRRSLDDILLNQDYVSASADPLTRTIYIALENASGKRRDFISICYELILENAFLDFYHNWQGSFRPHLLLRNMTIIAARFLADVLSWLDKSQGHSPDLRWLDAYLPPETFLGNESLYRAYMANLRDVFLKSNLLKLAQINKRLGLAEGDLSISF